MGLGQKFLTADRQCALNKLMTLTLSYNYSLQGCNSS